MHIIIIRRGGSLEAGRFVEVLDVSGSQCLRFHGQTGQGKLLDREDEATDIIRNVEKCLRNDRALSVAVLRM